MTPSTTCSINGKHSALASALAANFLELKSTEGHLNLSYVSPCLFLSPLVKLCRNTLAMLFSNPQSIMTLNYFPKKKEERNLKLLLINALYEKKC